MNSVEKELQFCADRGRSEALPLNICIRTCFSLYIS